METYKNLDLMETYKDLQKAWFEKTYKGLNKACEFGKHLSGWHTLEPLERCFFERFSVIGRRDFNQRMSALFQWFAEQIGYAVFRYDVMHMSSRGYNAST